MKTTSFAAKLIASRKNPLFRFLRKTASILAMIRFHHVIFALPFALISFMIAVQHLPKDQVFFSMFLKIVLAVLFARNAAMTFNRLVDLPFDCQNPRTIKRPLVCGEVSVPFAVIFLGVNSVFFILVSYTLNRLAFLLSIPTLFVLLFYSLTKRFTAWSHFFLGLALSLAPLGAWVGVLGEISWMPFFLALSVFFWVAGFDIIYATQDEATDRQCGLHSAIVRLGRNRALGLARLCHFFMIPCLFLFFGFTPQLHTFFLVSIGVITLLLIYEHYLVSPRKIAQNPQQELQKINTAFFRVNGVISLMLLLATGLDLL